jgi:UPF0755 protein
MDVHNEKTPYQKPAPHGMRARFFVYLCIAGIVLSGALTSDQIYFPHTRFEGKKTVIVSSGMGSRVIGTLLKREGIIGSKWAFVTYVSVRGEASDLKPGRYEFFDTAAIPSITRDLVAGSVRERVIVIPEGWGTADIARELADQGMASSRDAALDFFANPPADTAARYNFLAGAAPQSGLEGYLFPDTYRIFQDATIDTIAAKMLDNFSRKFTTDLRAEADRQEKSISEIITMASLIEKEVVSDEDRAVVSGVLWKRLDAGIPLQVDATVIYALARAGQIRAHQGYKISAQDIKIDSPYNTYHYRGLPPGPIANPGLSAIRAALYPRPSPYLFYLSSPDGRTIFSRTLADHNAAKNKYLR